ncbi:membrane protein [Nocardioides psychrotolerans]|uniref:EamA-like transporter family protein n=1 Tax=Nocardioides psychrotolerans TaxID=1005945 RepID=A0A1I3QTW9_9ACTN|nr:DMT family transporter [Nocardioides psychrotolerans]GEP37138.1 membrane protein [Nocardioides psychrotolerans]SFJ36557.1 EamA-like transporter family protein [Nocardioides psychrotolerans]
MLTAVVLTLVGSVAHAAWNLLASRAHAEDSGLFVWVYSVLSLVLLAPAALVAVLLGAELSWTLVGAGAVSALFHTAYAVSLQAAYARSDLNVTYPVARGLGPVLAAGFAVAVLGERPGVLGWLGIALIAAGVGVVSTGAAAPESRARRAAGLRWGLLIATAIAAYTLWDAHAVAGLGVDPVTYYAVGGAWMVVVLSVVCAGRLGGAGAVLRRHWRTGVAVAVLSPVAYVLVLVALTLAPVSVVAPLRSTSIVVGSLAAWCWLGEAHGGRRLAGAAVVTVGVAALVLG